jgi:hypothetical protein
MKNIQYLDAMMGGGVPPYRIDAADGAKTSLAFDRIWVAADVILTTLTDSADANMLTLMNTASNTDTLHAGLIISAGEGKTIKAVTVKSGDAGVIYGITFASPGV